MKEKAIELVNTFKKGIQNEIGYVGSLTIFHAAKKSALLHCDLMIEKLEVFDSEEVKLGISYYKELKEEIEKL